MPGPRLARKRPTGVSSPSGASSSTRPSPTCIDAASTPCASTRSRYSSRAPNRRSYVCTASSRSATATPTWWIPRASTRAMLPPVGRVGLREPLRGVLRRRDDLRHADRLGRPRLRFDAGEELDHLVADEGLLLEQQAGQPVERAAVLLEQANGRGGRGVGATSLLLGAQ